MDGVCKVAGCDNPVKAKGLCGRHYEAGRRHRLGVKPRKFVKRTGKMTVARPKDARPAEPITREKLARDVAAFLKGGGEFEKLPGPSDDGPVRGVAYSRW